MSVTFRVVRMTGVGAVDCCAHASAMNLSNNNALVLLGALRADFEEDDLVGNLTLAEARRCWLVATNTDVSKHLRPFSDTQLPGQCRVIRHGCDAAQLASYLDQFSQLISRGVRAGATHLVWD